LVSDNVVRVVMSMKFLSNFWGVSLSWRVVAMVWFDQHLFVGKTLRYETVSGNVDVDTEC